MVGRRWSDGLHQAVEAKEGVKIQHENQTLASITFQNYFRMYEKLSGMTGTADTEAYEFQEIYGLETVIIPTNKPMVRKDQNDQVFKTNEEKQRHPQRHPRLPRARPACAGGHDQHREFRARRPAAEGSSSTKCSTPSSTRAKPRSSPRPASRATSPSPPTWRAAAPTSCWAAARTRIDLIRADESLTETEKTLRIEKVRSEWKPLNEQVGCRRPAHHRHRAP